jgi:trans-aconitate methyltransferase
MGGEVIPLHALVSDLAQRLVTFNKLEQRRHLARSIRQLQPRTGARLLDFGCGTGLFARTLHGLGLTYWGFDPDVAAVQYASWLYPDLRFVSAIEDAEAAAPYDVVLANCCFHHISDRDLHETTLPTIARLMSSDATLLLCDVLPLEEGASVIRRLYNTFEQGAARRTASELERLLADRFAVRARRVQRSFVLSAAVPVNPVYNDLIVYELVLA